jgi:hypothetical protein
MKPVQSGGSVVEGPQPTHAQPHPTPPIQPSPQLRGPDTGGDGPKKKASELLRSPPRSARLGLATAMRWFLGVAVLGMLLATCSVALQQQPPQPRAPQGPDPGGDGPQKSPQQPPSFSPMA